MNARPTVAVFAMDGQGHVQRLRPLVAALVERHIDVYVFTEARFEGDIRHDGGIFVDLYDGRPMDAADDESRPMACRYVSFAGHYAEDVIRQVAALQPSLVVADTYALIGSLVATELGIPYVNVCAGFSVDPEPLVAQLEADPRLHVGPGLASAIEVLRDRYGLANASPFSYIRGQSTVLNLYCEPPQYLTDDERRGFEPVVFFGSLPSTSEIAALDHKPLRPWFLDERAELALYISFGTVVWWSTAADPRFATAADALAAIRALSNAVAKRKEISALISVGGTNLDPAVVNGLRQPNVTVETYVDQWEVLRQADLFVTHHGLNSTHESIANRVPMLSYPFIGDQPPRALKCEALGIARPLAPTVRAPLDDNLVNAALDDYLARRAEFDDAIARAREWELTIIADRGEIVEQIIDLM